MLLSEIEADCLISNIGSFLPLQTTYFPEHPATVEHHPYRASGLVLGSIAANSTRFGRARSSDEKIVLEPRLKVTVEDSLRHNMRLPFDASVETTKT